MDKVATNPWGLIPCEVRLMDELLAKKMCDAAYDLGISRCTAYGYAQSIRMKMSCTGHHEYRVNWRRWRDAHPATDDDGDDEETAAGVKNPWKLTLTQVDALDALCEKGTMVRAAERLRVTHAAISRSLRRAQSKMAVVGNEKGVLIRMVVAWTTWRQNEGKGVPA